VCEPATEPAASIIDWDLACPRIGDRTRPLAPATRARILAGLQRYGWAPITTSGAGNVHERTPGNRARSVAEPLPVQQTTATTALAVPPSMVLANNFGNVPATTAEPLSTATTGNRHALVVPLRRNGHAAPVEHPAPAVTAGGNHHALLMRNNTGSGEMVTPVTEPARTMTTAGHQSLLVPAVALDDVVDECGFRMLEPYEVAAAMAFPDGYIPRTLPKVDQVKLAGNAVTPPVMTWIVGRILQTLEAAA
jgi:DNA (cytosine-5)-methyltransferase 1